MQKNIKDLQLNDAQMQVYKTLRKKEKVLRGVLYDAGISYKVIDKIIDATDLNKVDINTPNLLKEQAIKTWGAFIVRDKKKGQYENGKC